jgi:ABC-type Zn uptake system ZnuABC Zn-binding protein ZnuA
MRHFFIFIIVCLSISYGYSQKIKVLATTSMIADMARNIAGDRLEVQCILPIGGDPHIYEPTPRDAQKAADADLILVNGLTLEGWMKELITNSGTKAKVVVVTEGITAITSAEHKGAADPHAWMTASNGLIYVENIYKSFTQITPTDKDFFEKNYRKYAAELSEVDTYIKNKILQIPDSQRILITSHDAFHYYGTRYGLRLESVMGTSTDADVQTSDIIRLVKIIKKSGVSSIFIESTINPKLLKQLAKDNLVVVGGNLFADSLGDEKSGADSYVKMLRHNADVISKALSTPKSAIYVANTEGVNPFSLTFTFFGFVGLCGVCVWFLGKKR